MLLLRQKMIVNRQLAARSDRISHVHQEAGQGSIGQPGSSVMPYESTDEDFQPQHIRACWQSRLATELLVSKRGCHLACSSEGLGGAADRVGDEKDILA